MQEKASFLVAVLEHIRGRLDAHEHDLATAFTRQFWSRVAAEDLDDRSIDDAAAMTIACLRHFERRAWNAVDIDVENPQRDRDGWASDSTIVQIAHPDMPFITDSVLMELSHRGLVTHHLQNMVFATVRDAQGRLLEIDPAAPDARREVLIYAEIDRLEATRLTTLEAQLVSILKDVRAAVGGFLGDEDAIARDWSSRCETRRHRWRPKRSQSRLHSSSGSTRATSCFSDIGSSTSAAARSVRCRTARWVSCAIESRHRSGYFRISHRTRRRFFSSPRCLRFRNRELVRRYIARRIPTTSPSNASTPRANVIGEQGFLGLYTSAGV